MSDSSLTPILTPILATRQTVVTLFLFGSVIIPNEISAENIEFSTKDGRHKTRGTVASFITPDGEITKLPRSITRELKVVIKRQDGTTTAPIQLSTLSDKTLGDITNFVIRSRKREQVEKPATDKPTDFFLKNQKRLIALATDYSALGPINQVDPVAKEQYLTELNAYKKELGPSANTDWAVRFTLAFLAGEYGSNKYGEMYLIAKDCKDFWPAWQTAIIFSLRYRADINECIQLMDQFLDELTEYRKTHENGSNVETLKNTGHAALWLREAASLLESSGLASDSGSNRLKQIQLSSTVTTLIKTSEIPDAVLDQAKKRRLELEKERIANEAEAHRIKQLALDKRIRECRKLLQQFVTTYDKQWEYGKEAFDRQQLITVEAHQHFQTADQKFRSANRRCTEWSIIASRPLGEDASDSEVRYKQNAEDRAEFYRREQDRYYYEMKTRRSIFYMHRQKLAQTHSVLADFVNRGKNQLILFESNYVDTIKADQALKQDYIDFTDKVKAVIAQLPPMPTITIAPKDDVKLQTHAADQAQREKVSELSFSLSVDLRLFLAQLAAP